MVEAGVHATVGAEAEEVELLARLLNVVVGSLDFLVLHQFVVAASHIDLYEILIYHAACSEVHMSHLGISHLSVRKTHILAAGLKMGHRVFCPEAVDKRSALGVNRIGTVVTAFSPAVENHQKYFSVHFL